MFKNFQDVVCAVAIAACAACLLLASPVRAADAASTDDTLYRALGEKAGIAVVMDDFAGRVKTDERLKTFFKDVNRKSLAGQLTDQICRLSGGPCVYDGANMKDAHKELGVARADFNALVEVLQDAMAAHNWPFSTQNQLLARLAPMHRDIVTK